MTRYFEALMAETFTACGEDPARAAQLASAAVKTVMASGVTWPQAMESFEMDAKICQLRSQGLQEPELKERLGCCKRRIYRAMVRHAQVKRAALKVRSEVQTLEPLGKVG